MHEFRVSETIRATEQRQSKFKAIQASVLEQQVPIGRSINAKRFPLNLSTPLPEAPPAVSEPIRLLTMLFEPHFPRKLFHEAILVI